MIKSEMTMSGMVLVGREMVEMMRWKVSMMVLVSEMSKMKIRVMVGMWIRELEGRMIKNEMTVSGMVLMGREMVEMVIKS